MPSRPKLEAGRIARHLRSLHGELRRGEARAYLNAANLVNHANFHSIFSNYAERIPHFRAYEIAMIA